MTSIHNSTASDSEIEKTVGFLDHLEELRKRLLRCIVAIGIVSIGALYFGEEILKYFMMPMGAVTLHYTEIGGAFSSYFKVALLAAVVISAPYIFWQLWGFIAPGLYRRERMVALVAISASSILFLIGAAFCFYIVLPYTVSYLVTFEQELFTPIITIDNYISFAGWMIVSFGAGFTMPVIAYFLAKIGLITVSTLTSARRVSLVIILFLAAILTPSPDILSQLSLAIPLYALYEVSVLVVWVATRRDT